MVQVRKVESEAIAGSIDVAAWLQRLRAKLETEELERVSEAVAMAQEAAPKQPNKNAFNRPERNCFFAGLEMAEILADFKLDQDSLVAAILYRAVREGRLQLSAVRQQFGDAVCKLIEGVQQMAVISAVRATHDTAVLGDSRRQIENIRKMLVSLVDDVRVALIKLAERTWAIRAVKNESDERCQKVAREVFDIYAPLAHRLGIGHLKWELEDISFRYLEPESYKLIASLLAERRLDRDGYIKNVIELLQAQLKAVYIDATITGRAKHIYSIWRKMQRKQITFDQVHDIRAVRILVPEARDCYAALGVVHALWRHIPREFDDYIATPKANGYQSLHTAVIGPEGKVLEVQIRTPEMHEDAEYGVCSHWRYKGTDKSQVEQGYEDKVEWLRQLLQWHEEVGGLDSLVEELRIDIDPGRIYVFTPAGHVVDLVKDATPIDFAYRVHTEIGHHCRGAKVNGRIVTLNHKLRTGDNVEILTSKSGSPSRDWLNPSLGYAMASRTRSKIQHWFKLQDKEKNALAGRAIVDRELRRLALASVDTDALAQKVNYQNAEDMFAAIGAGDLRLAQVVGAAQEQVEPRGEALVEPEFKLARSGPVTSSQDLEFMGVDNLMSSFAGCCKPVPGDDSLGYITQGRGISIHRRDCANARALQENEPDRIIDVHWGNKASDNYPVDIMVLAFDRAGLLRDVTTVFANESVNVIAMNSFTNDKNNMVDLRVTAEVPNLDVLSRVLSKINQLPNMIEVKRVRAGS